MLITNSNNNQSGIRKRTLPREIKVGPVSIQFIIIIILAALALLYLAQTTQGATKSYKIRELEDQKQELLKDGERLELESLRLKSLNEIKSSIEGSELEPSKQINYLPSDNDQLVRR